MNRAIRATLATMFAVALTTAPVLAQVTIRPVRGCIGELAIDGRTGAQHWSAVPSRPQAVTTVYDNLDSPPNFAIGSMQNEVGWGDSLITTGTGTIESLSFTIYNGEDALDVIRGAHVVLRFRDAATDQILATAAYDPQFTTGIPAGYYSIITLNTPGSTIALGTKTLLIEQSMTLTGFPIEPGIVSFTPPTVGSSPASMFTTLATEWGGPGFMTISGYVCNPGYRLGLDVGSPATATSWGRVKHLYR